MSAATKAAFEQAMQAHIEDECEQSELVTAYIISASISSFEDEDSRHTYWFDNASGQGAHISRGLIELVRDWAQSDMNYGEDDDD